ncbi:MAG: hypothetical protein B6D38_07600 [Anaerolineae bacterium UTCFX1]|jgi:signal transduction histidine kinase/DNA-binding response OmpR family regulator|nr:MAG: hypothetical protein B6D38_07600 [Anaerolineae bacterium UTCFX1]
MESSSNHGIFLLNWQRILIRMRLYGDVRATFVNLWRLFTVTDNHPSAVSAIRVLVVDDQPGLAQTLAVAISRIGNGVTAVAAVSAKQALDLATTGAVDILVTDMVMPDMTGLELAEKMQNHPGGRPAHTILMTAYEVPGLKETARRLNIKETIIKPFHPERINQLIVKVMNGMTAYKEIELEEGPQSFKILIADDIPDNVVLLSRYMQNEGFRYVTASNGVETLKITRTEMPDLILLDVAMPEKDGLQVLREIRDDPIIRHIPVIIITAARPHLSDIQAGLVLGADDYIIKPFDRRELFARIRAKLRLKEARDALVRRNRELSILPEIGRQLSARLDIHELSELVLRRTVETLGALVGHLFILNSKNPIHKEYHIAASSDPQTQIPALGELLKQVEGNRECTLVEDTQLDPRWAPALKGQSHSAIIVPMLGRNDLLGLFILVHERKGYFGFEHQILLQAIASQAGIAVENAQLYATVAREESRLTAILENAADAILLFDATHCLALMNPAAEKLFDDYQAQLGSPLARGSGYDALLDLLTQTSGNSLRVTGEIDWRGQRIFSASLTPLYEGGCVVVLHDITHFKQLDKIKDELIATASHDLRNPLTSIIGYNQLIKQSGSLSKTQVEFTERIQHAADHMTQLVENMLELAKMDLGATSNRELIKMAPLLLELADEFIPQATAKNQRLTLEPVDEHLTVIGDALNIQQALRNLIGNAIKYTPHEGSITLSAERCDSMMHIRVQDTGYGIPASDIPNLFNRFYRVRNNGHDHIEGNGLGLAIVKSITESLGGNVSVESEPGKGSCFTFSLPLAEN